MTKPISLTDDQLGMITQELGDGLVARTCAEMQQKWLVLPADERHGAMWDRALR